MLDPLEGAMLPPMPRHARLVADGVPLHVVQRGNNHSNCFFGTADYNYFLDKLRELAAEHQVAVHAYVLMTNHVHLLVTPRAAVELSKLMRRLTQNHAQRLNCVHGRSGTLWEGRFKSSMVDEDSYFLACQRYIELNPVRAGITPDPARYRWSSYAANGGGGVDSILTSHPVYEALGPDRRARARAYRDLFETELPSEVVEKFRESAKGGFAVGAPPFVSRMEEALGRRVVPARPGRPRLQK